MGSAAFSVSFFLSTYVSCFLGVVNIVQIPEFLALETSIELEK
jgi:hypothetical protein